MVGPSIHATRRPAVAGSFYPADPDQCRALARQYTHADKFSSHGGESSFGDLAQQEEAVSNVRREMIGGVVPHAGWICSGAIAGQTVGELRSGPTAGSVDLVVVFGAIHTPIPMQVAALDSYSGWELPGETPCQVLDELRRKIVESSDVCCIDDRFHSREHAVEVELPLIRSVWPTAAILPVEVPVNDKAIEIGRQVAQAAKQLNRHAVFLASSDLTHYGPNYGFAPAGVGPQGLDWAKRNDLALIERILKMQAEAIVPEVKAHANACGAGAIAAMLSACREFGGVEAKLLRHATSFETLTAAGIAQKSDNAVGYASIVIST